MPRVDVWIRKDDYEVWQRIRDKPGFLRASIRAFTTTDSIDVSAKVLRENRASKKPAVALGVLDAIPQVQALKFCRHGADPDLCKFKKPGKPCK